jgi:hypothetical protein
MSGDFRDGVSWRSGLLAAATLRDGNILRARFAAVGASPMKVPFEPMAAKSRRFASRPSAKRYRSVPLRDVGAP